MCVLRANARVACSEHRLDFHFWRSGAVNDTTCKNDSTATQFAPLAISNPNQKTLESKEVFGVPVACATYDSALQRIQALAREPRPAAVCPANTHILAEVRRRPDFGRVLAKFDLVLPDGMPVVWTINRFGAGLKDRVYGPYFMRHALCHTPKPWRHFFFGDSEDTISELRQAVTRLQPDIEIAGAISPPFRHWTEADESFFATQINEARPDFVWVALPGVRMERWIIENQWRYTRGVFLAVGDAFSLLSGRRCFAPQWMQRLGLTWLYRLSHEPARLGPRYVHYNTLYVYYAIRELCARRS